MQASVRVGSEFRELRMKRDPACPMCGPDAPTSLDEIEYNNVSCAIPAGLLAGVA